MEDGWYWYKAAQDDTVGQRDIWRIVLVERDQAEASLGKWGADSDPIPVEQLTGRFVGPITPPADLVEDRN